MSRRVPKNLHRNDFLDASVLEPFGGSSDSGALVSDCNPKRQRGTHDDRSLADASGCDMLVFSVNVTLASQFYVKSVAGRSNLYRLRCNRFE